MSSATKTSSESALQMKHMRSFRCIGSDCPNTCCHGWRVLLSQDEHERIRRTLEPAPHGAARFKQGIERFKGHPRLKASRQHFAVIRMEEDSRDCHFMTPKGWCGLQEEFGEEILGDVCYAYPRQLKRFGNRVELTGSLGCPEVVRGALLDEHGCQWEGVEKIEMSRQVFTKRTVHTDASPYVASLDLVREVFQTVVNVREVSLQARLLSLGMFGARLRPEFNARSGSQRANVALHEGISRLLQPQELLDAQRFLEGAQVNMKTLASLMQRLVSVSASGTEFDRFRRMSREVINSYLAFARHEMVDDEASSFEVPTSVLFSSYFTLSRWLQSHLSEMTNDIERRFCSHYINAHWHTECPDLFLYLQRLVIEVTLMRFLCAGHPDVLCFLNAHDFDLEDLPQAISAERHAELEALWAEVYIDVVHLLARSTEHSPSTLSELDEAMAETGLQPMAVLTYLLKL